MQINGKLKLYPPTRNKMCAEIRFQEAYDPENIYAKISCNLIKHTSFYLCHLSQGQCSNDYILFLLKHLRLFL